VATVSSWQTGIFLGAQQSWRFPFSRGPTCQAPKRAFLNERASPEQVVGRPPQLPHHCAKVAAAQLVVTPKAQPARMLGA
jgi:hypothetical protein